MKYSIHELKEKTSIHLSYDYSEQIKEIIDIISIDLATITANVTYKQGELILDTHVEVPMVLACSKTLKPVNHQLVFDANIVFSNDEDSDFPLEDPIELTDIIFGYIVSEKPYTIYHPDAKDTSFEPERSPHPAFADLDKIVKK